MKKYIFMFAFLALSTFTAFSQTTFDVPQQVRLKSEADYARYEADIVNAAKWLEETDLDKQTDKRQTVNAFVMQWIMGTPSVTIDLSEPLMKLTAENSNLLAIYMASYTRDFLENKMSATKETATKAGLISMAKVYKKKLGVNKNKDLEKLVKAYDENKLDEYIQSKFK